jgi:outer membrane protein TolC
MNARNLAASILLALGLGSACVPHDAGYGDTRRLVKERTGTDVRWHHMDGVLDARQQARKLLQQPLSAQDAVQVALLNNPALQAKFEDLGVARAIMAGDARLPNPHLEAGLRYGGGDHSPDIELGAMISLTRLVMMPTRRAAGAAQVDAAAIEVAGEAVALAHKVKSRFFALSAADQAKKLERQALLSARASYEAAKELRRAGNITELRLASEAAVYEEQRLATASAELDAATARGEFATVLGLWGDATRVRIISGLPEVPLKDLDLTKLEATAVRRSLDLAAEKARFTAAGRRANVARTEGYFPNVSGGVVFERQDAEWEVGPQVEVALPIFDQGQGPIGMAEAEMRRASQNTTALAVRVRSAAREGALRLESARARAQHYERTLVPIRKRVLDETLLQYNAMNTGVFELLQAKRDLLSTQRRALDARREYWTARAAVEALVAGRLVDDSGASVGASAGPVSAAGGGGH